MSALLNWLAPLLNPQACLPPEPEFPESQNAESLLKRLDILLRQKLKHAMAGEQKSILKGQGLDFADLREYIPGDDIRKMDWSVFARTLTPHIREYHEEKQLTLWLVLDLTPSMRFGQQKSKLWQAIELAGLFGLLAERAGHKLGAFLITGDQPEIIPPACNHAHLRRIIQRMMDRNALSGASTPLAADPLPALCPQLNHVIARQHTVILLSDFIAFSDSWRIALGQLSHKARILSLMLIDPVERELPANVGLLNLQDPETGQRLQLDTGNPATLKAYRLQAQQRQTQTLSLLKDWGAAVYASTKSDPLDILFDLLKTGSIAA